MIIHDISRDTITTPVYNGDPKTEVEQLMSLENGDECNLSKISMCVHSGTHIDAPLHYCEDGNSIDTIRLNTFYGKCTVIETSGVLTGSDMDHILPYCRPRILLKGSGEAFLSSSAAFVLASSNIKLIGTDSNSIAAEFDENKTHRILAQAGIAILENCDLSRVNSGEYELFAFPIKLCGLEAAPCRAILLEQERGLNRK